ncbi:MAG: hypothetical protein K7J46_16190, partial [Bryobacter sp.]|nr:hypothetical protein [Bryobacter sp. CoA8 C33]
SRRIVSNISILALLCILPACQIKPRQVFKGGPNQAIEMGQIRVAKSPSSDGVKEVLGSARIDRRFSGWALSR